MTAEAPAEAALLERALRRTQWSVLGLLATCAVLILLRGMPDDEPPPDRVIASLGVLLALGAVVLRRVGGSPAISPRSAVYFRLAGLLGCGALGVLGMHLAYGLGSPQSGLLFTLAGGIFALRPSQPTASRRD